MNGAATIGLLVFYGVSLQATLAAVRDPRGGARAHAYVMATGSFTLGSICLALLVYFYEGESGPTILGEADKLLLTIALLMTAVGLLLWVGSLARRHRLLDEESEARHRTPLLERIKFSLALASPKWKELEAPGYALEDHQGASRTARFMVVGTSLVAFPSVVVLLGSTMMMNIRGSSASDFASHIVGYYTLLTATSWTITFVATLVLVAIQQSLSSGTKQTLDLADVVLAVGTWAGFGAAGGVFVGALIPVAVILIPSGPFKSLDITLLDAITPDLLLSTSAAGAVLGFLLGEVISLVSYAAEEQNLLTRTVFPPVLFGVLATLFGLFGLRPGAISQHLAKLYRAEDKQMSYSGDDPFTVAKHVDMDSSDGWAEMVEAFDKSGWNHMVDSYIYFWGTWLAVILVVLFSYSLSTYKRELQLAAFSKEGGAGSAEGGASSGPDGGGGSNGSGGPQEVASDPIEHTIDPDLKPPTLPL